MNTRMRAIVLHPATIGLVAGLVVVGLWRLTSGIGGTGDALDADPTVPTVLLPVTEEVLLDGGWSRVDLPGRSRLRNVWEVGGRFYASGWDSSAQRTVVWTSPDGSVWRPVVADNAQFDDAAVHDMVGFDGLVIAVGARIVRDHPVFDEVAVPAVWRSDDGEVFDPVELDVDLWTPADTQSPESFVGGGLTSIQPFGDGLLLGGWEGVGDILSGAGSTRPGMWRTENVITLARFSTDFVAEDTPGIVRTLTTDGQLIIAAGSLNDEASIWTSVDGLTWDRLIADTDLGSTATAATPTNSGALILGVGVVKEGEEVSDARRLWASGNDGFTTIAATGLDGAQITDVGAGGVGVVAVGFVEASDGSTSGAMWASADADTWQRITIDPVPRDSEIHSVVVGERALVAVGEVHDQPSVWVRPIDEDQEVTAGVGSLFVPPSWSTVFQQQDPDGSVPSSMQRAGDFLYGLSSTRSLWQSQDGDVWTLKDFDTVGLGGADAIAQIVASEVGWVAVGENVSAPLWFSADGEVWGRPTLAPPCCAVAVFRDAPGFTALLRDEPADGWQRATTVDGLVWEVDAIPLSLPVSTVDHVASIGRLGLLWGIPFGESGTLHGSIDGVFWFPIRGPEGVFDRVEWSQVWDLGGEIVASGTVAGDPVLYRSVDGVDWQSLELPSPGEDELSIQDVGGFGDGLAVLVSFGTQPSRLLTFSGIGTQAEVPLDLASGFGGLWSILVPNDQSLRMLGPDHGRMTIWEWIPSPSQ